MKKIYYLFACVALMITVASCSPLDKTYEAVGPGPVTPPPVSPTVDNITLTDADYNSLPPADPAQSAKFFRSDADAINSVPAILNEKYSTASEKSQITVNYLLSPSCPPYFKPADSTYNNLTYTLVNPDDYLKVPDNKYPDLNSTDILRWLTVKYSTPVANQLAIITFIYYDGTTSTVTQAFIYLNNAWKKAYLVSPAQYASVNRGMANNFVTADNNIATLTGYFNTFLKTDPLIAGSAHIGDIQYVSYKLNSFQRVLPLVYDGVNWVSKTVTSSNTFTKTNGIWALTLDSSLPYTLVGADYTTISKIPGVASDLAIANLVAHPSNFSLTLWNDSQITTGLLAILKTAFPAATKDQTFKLTYVVYASTNVTVTKKFSFDGTAFKVIPTTTHMLDVDDFTAISTSSIATAPQRSDVAKYGDFDTSWSAADIQSVLILSLTRVFTTPQTNVTYSIVYTAYSGGATSKTVNFTYDGTKWVAK